MSTAASSPELETVKWYTRARRFPQLLGRTPDGTKIPGGPYTITQAIGAGLVLFVGVNTMGLWARYGMFGNAAALLGLTALTVVGLGRIPVGSRNPLSVLSGLAHAMAGPHAGRVAGRPVRLRRPHQLTHRMTVCHQTPQQQHISTTTDRRAARLQHQQPPTAGRNPVAPGPRPRTAAPPRPALTGVQALLATPTTKIKDPH